MNQTRLKTAEDVKIEIEQYLEAKDQSEQAGDHEGGYIAAIRHKDHDKDDGVKKKLKDKGKGGKDKGKGKTRRKAARTRASCTRDLAKTPVLRQADSEANAIGARE